MLKFEPELYINDDGRAFWHPKLPDGTLIYYRPDHELVTVSKAAGDLRGYTPAVSDTFRDAVRAAKIVWKDKLKADKQRDDS